MGICFPGENLFILIGVVSHIKSIISGPISQKFKIVVLFEVAAYPTIFFFFYFSLFNNLLSSYFDFSTSLLNSSILSRLSTPLFFSSSK